MVTPDVLSPAAQALLAYIRTQDSVTFAEMSRVLAPLIPLKGPIAAELSTLPNLVLWTGMSQEWLDTLNELRAAQLIYPEPCSVLVYLIDGCAQTLPVAKRPPKGGYKELHWLPVCFRPRDTLSRAQPRTSRQKGTPR